MRREQSKAIKCDCFNFVLCSFFIEINNKEGKNHGKDQTSNKENNKESSKGSSLAFKTVTVTKFIHIDKIEKRG